LLAREIRSRAYEILDGASAQVLRELFRAVRCAANEPGELRRVLIEIVSSETGGFHDVADHVRSGGHLHVKETLGLLGGVGCKRGSGLFCSVACLACRIGNL
jgi:hypothetical protein